MTEDIIWSLIVRPLVSAFLPFGTHTYNTFAASSLGGGRAVHISLGTLVNGGACFSRRWLA